MASRYHLEPIDAAAVADGHGMGRGFITVPEACELLDCSKTMFEKIVVRDGLVPHGSDFGGIRFYRCKIEALLKPLSPAEANRRMDLVVVPSVDADGFRYYRDAAKMAGVSPAKVQRWAREKKIPAKPRNLKPNACRQHWWVHPRDVQNYDQRSTAQTAVAEADAFRRFQKDMGHEPISKPSRHHTSKTPWSTP